MNGGDMRDYIKAQGYRVFYNPDQGDNVTYCFYTDGERIAYAQWPGYETSVSTVHMPNLSNGTGFRIADTITPGTLREALYCVSPAWHRGKRVAKYRSWEDFARSHIGPLKEWEGEA